MERANVLVPCAKHCRPCRRSVCPGVWDGPLKGVGKADSGDTVQGGCQGGLCRNGRVWKGRGDVYTGSKRRGTHPSKAPAVRHSKGGQRACFPLCSHLERRMESPRGLVAPGQFHPGCGTMTRRGQMLPGWGGGGTAAVPTSFRGPRLGGDPARQPLPTRG